MLLEQLLGELLPTSTGEHCGVGDARDVVEGDMAPKGFLLLWDEFSPARLPIDPV